MLLGLWKTLNTNLTYLIDVFFVRGETTEVLCVEVLKVRFTRRQRHGHSYIWIADERVDLVGEVIGVDEVLRRVIEAVSHIVALFDAVQVFDELHGAIGDVDAVVFGDVIPRLDGVDRAHLLGLLLPHAEVPEEAQHGQLDPGDALVYPHHGDLDVVGFAVILDG